MYAAMEILWMQVSFVISPVTQSLVGVWFGLGGGFILYTRVFGVLVIVLIYYRYHDDKDKGG